MTIAVDLGRKATKQPNYLAELELILKFLCRPVMVSMMLKPISEERGSRVLVSGLRGCGFYPH